MLRTTTPVRGGSNGQASDGFARVLGQQDVRRGILGELDRQTPGFSALLPNRVMHPSDLEKLATKGNRVFTVRNVCSDPSGGYTPVVVVKEVGTGRVLLIGIPGEHDTILPVSDFNLRAVCRYYRGLQSRYRYAANSVPKP